MNKNHWLFFMSKKERIWLLVAILAIYLTDLAVFFLAGVWYYIAWSIVCLPLGYLWGRMMKRRHKLRLAEEWRETHRGLSDYWLPEELKGG